MTDLYAYLSVIMPIKRVLIAMAVGLASLFIVTISGLTSEVVRSEILVSRAFSAFAFASLASFILIMCAEEFALFKANREYERFIDDAQIEILADDFNIDDYLRNDDVASSFDAKKPQTLETKLDDSFHSINFNNLPYQT